MAKEKKGKTKGEGAPVTPEVYERHPIRARIIDSENGMKFYPEVSAVRIKSKDYRLLVMEDYVPALGRIDGSVVLLTPDGEVSYGGIYGFYKHQHNEFTLLIERQGEQGVQERNEAEKA